MEALGNPVVHRCCSITDCDFRCVSSSVSGRFVQLRIGALLIIFNIANVGAGQRLEVRRCGIGIIEGCDREADAVNLSVRICHSGTIFQRLISNLLHGQRCKRRSTLVVFAILLVEFIHPIDIECRPDEGNGYRVVIAIAKVASVSAASCGDRPRLTLVNRVCQLMLMRIVEEAGIQLSAVKMGVCAIYIRQGRIGGIIISINIISEKRLIRRSGAAVQHITAGEHMR